MQYSPLGGFRKLCIISYALYEMLYMTYCGIYFFVRSLPPERSLSYKREGEFHEEDLDVKENSLSKLAMKIDYLWLS